MEVIVSDKEGKSNGEELLHCLIHDLRRPVGMGTGYSELLMLEIPVSEKKQREYIEKISQQFKDITQMLDEYQQKLQVL